ncbi:MAG: MFS transporter [SAR202 cluster bacterium]|jgi:cyanate permease|nr:MFS transporter [Dehalococcoidia bacterium]MQF90119.1 MFS transporter [SAR202 cluster bacterium]|tara:strand:- start:3175 stop:4434 length:1260 start_codon:yes stop_codon:yes gene_type:complete
MANAPENISHPSAPAETLYRFVIAGLVLGGHLSVGLNVFAVSPLLPLAIDEYDISRAAAGLLVALPLLVAAALGLPSGILIARIGLRRAFIIGWTAVALVALSGLAPNFITLLLLRSATGLGFAFILTATGPLLMQWFRPKEVTAMNALTTAALSLGIALSVATAAPLAKVMDWQTTLTVFAIPGIAGLVAWLVLGRDSGGQPMTGAGISLREVGAVLRNRAVVLLLAADAGILVQYTAFTGWLPTFYNEDRGISLSQAGFITGLLPLVGVFAVLVGGVVALRVASPRALFAASGLLAGMGGLGAFLLPGQALIYPAVVIMGIGSWVYVPKLLTLPMQMPGMTPERVAVVWGSLLTFSGFAMFVSPIFVGGLRDISGSFIPGLAIAAAASWALLVAGILLPKNVTDSPARSPQAPSPLD